LLFKGVTANENPLGLERAPDRCRMPSFGECEKPSKSAVVGESGISSSPCCLSLSRLRRLHLATADSVAMDTGNCTWALNSINIRLFLQTQQSECITALSTSTYVRSTGTSFKIPILCHDISHLQRKRRNCRLAWCELTVTEPTTRAVAPTNLGELLKVLLRMGSNLYDRSSWDCPRDQLPVPAKLFQSHHKCCVFCTENYERCGV
jgi:hypothetical protein